MAMTEVGIYLKAMRRGRGYTQESLAEAIGIAKRTIQRLERNEGDVTVLVFVRVIAALDASGDQVTYLATHPETTADEAKAMAFARLQSSKPATNESGRRTQEPAKTTGARTAQPILNELQHLDAQELIEVVFEASRMLRERFGMP